MDATGHLVGIQFQINPGRFEHIGVAEGDVFPVGELWLSVLETAGHTPEHVSYVVTDRTRGGDPWHLPKRATGGVTATA